ncbi:MAG TPA: hypothetical protein G4O18_02825 [Dehalococcoidia bacterium]|nr:hypothetical protein [Dehalococcoidia bacterium]
MATIRQSPMQRARLISNLLHPWVVLVPVVSLVAYDTAGESLEWVGWTLLTLASAFLLPAIYARIRASMLSGSETRQKISRDLFRDNFWDLLVMAVLFGICPILVLYYLDGPETLLATVVAVSVTMLAIALTNLVYRASFHLAMVTSMLSALWIHFGLVSLVTLPLLPVLGISRYQLGEHSPAQIVTGFFIGLAVSGAVFFGFGLIG